MAVAIQEMLPAVAALTQEDVRVRGVQDWLDVKVIDTTVAASTYTDIINNECETNIFEQF